MATRGPVEAFLEGVLVPVIAKAYRATPAELGDNPTAAGRVERWYPT